MRRRPEGRRLSVFVWSRRDRHTLRDRCASSRPCKFSKSSALASIVLVPAAGIEPTFTASETAVLPLDDTGVKTIRDPAGSRTQTVGVRDRCSPLSYETVRGSTRSRTETNRFKGPLHTTVLSTRASREGRAPFQSVVPFVHVVHRERIELSWPEGARFTAESVSITV